MSTDDRSRSDDGTNYEVGYRKPPKQTRFSKGHSGNPSGRPKGSKSTKSLLMAALDEKVTVNENGCSRQISKREAGVKQMANKVALGDLRTFKIVNEILAGDEERQDEQIRARDGQSAREQLARKLDDMSRRMRARLNLPPESQ